MSPFLLILLLFGGAFVLLRFRRPAAVTGAARPSGTPAEPRCGRCGYIVRGIGSLTCPECGSDLREVGIDVGPRRAGPTWLPAALALLLWTAAVVGAWEVARDAVMRAGPRARVTSYSARLSGPGSGGYVALSVAGSGERVGGPVAPGAGAYLSPPAIKVGDTPSVTFTADGPAGQLGTLTADLDTGRYAFTTPAARADGLDGFGQDAVVEWLARCAGHADGRAAPPALAAEARAAHFLTTLPPAQQHLAARPAADGTDTRTFGGSVSGRSSASNNADAGRREFGSWAESPAGGPFASASGTYDMAEHVRGWYAATVALVGLAVWTAGARWVARRFGAGGRRTKSA